MNSEIKIESTQSKIVSLKKVHEKKANLNAHRSGLLEKIPNIGDYGIFPKGHIDLEDLAFLTAATDCEFAWLSGKRDDILFHGERYRCSFDHKISEYLKTRKYSLYAHSHPDEDNPEPSVADRTTLEIIEQDQSMIISATTLRVTKYSNNQCLDYLL